MWACYVCPSAMCASMYVCTCMYICPSAMCARMHACIYVRVCMPFAMNVGLLRLSLCHVCTYAHMHVCACMYAFCYECGPATLILLPCVHVCVHVCMYVCISLCLPRRFMSPCMYVCIWDCVCRLTIIRNISNTYTPSWLHFYCSMPQVRSFRSCSPDSGSLQWCSPDALSAKELKSTT